MTSKKKPDAAGSDVDKKIAPVSKPAPKRKKKGRAEAARQETIAKHEENPPLPAGADDAESIQQKARALLDAEQRAMEEADQRNPVLPSIRTNPLGCATILKDRFFTKNDMPQLMYYRENWYCYYGELWSARTDDDMNKFVHGYLAKCRTVDSEGELQDFVTSRENVAQVRYQLGSIGGPASHVEAPFFHLLPKPKTMDASGKMVTLGQITDMLSGDQWSNQEVFMPNGAEWKFNKKASQPKQWLKFIDDLFADRSEDIELLQEWFGYVLSGDTWAQKGLLIVGPKRAGKGVIGHVLTKLLGKSMVASPALKKIGDNFGLENMVDKRLCLISDARLSNRADTMPVIEMLLRIIGGDQVDVTRKNKTALTLELGVRVMMLANSMPPLGDDSDAITSRFLIMKLSESFYGREDTKLAGKLEKELPKIALWAVSGYRRLIKRGHFQEPQSSVDARDEWYVENNPVAEFLEDCCVVARDQVVEAKTLGNAYEEWREPRKLNSMPTHVLSRKIAAMLGPKIKRLPGDGTKGRQIEGLGLKKLAF